jgi:hypothetical protein
VGVVTEISLLIGNQPVVGLVTEISLLIGNQPVVGVVTEICLLAGPPDRTGGYQSALVDKFGDIPSHCYHTWSTS